MTVAIDLSDKIALVTMSTTGIGFSIARKIAEAGAKVVVVNGRNRDNGERACSALRAAAPGVEATFIPADILDTAQIDLLRQAIANYRRVKKLLREWEDNTERLIDAQQPPQP